ncbi:MAG: hypothetical protein HKN93_12005, partial [Acidimicrobiia bacterium]|nr:hypothetical protein [Acidimicrobiia bacterium]
MRRLLGLVLVLALVVAACGEGSVSDDTQATTVATTTTEATTTTTTTTIATPPPIPIDAPEGFELVWNDEFDGDAINLDNWTYD